MNASNTSPDNLRRTWPTYFINACGAKMSNGNYKFRVMYRGSYIPLNNPVEFTTHAEAVKFVKQHEAAQR